MFETMAKELENLPLKDVGSKGGLQSEGESNGLKEMQNKLNKYSKDMKEFT